MITKNVGNKSVWERGEKGWIFDDCWGKMSQKLTERLCELLLEELVQRSMFWISPFEELLHIHRYGGDVVAMLCTCEQMKNDVINVVHMLSYDLIKPVQST